MSRRKTVVDVDVCDECGQELDNDEYGDGEKEWCSRCAKLPHEHAPASYGGEDDCGRCRARILDPGELSRRAMWHEEILRLLADLPSDALPGAPPPEPWQLELAARILARPYRWSITGRGDIWALAHTTATELGNAMVADGRLNEWGNWS